MMEFLTMCVFVCACVCSGLWILHAKPGQNIQLHFQDFSLETAFDMLEVRDGVEPRSTLLSEREFQKTSHSHAAVCIFITASYLQSA